MDARHLGPAATLLATLTLASCGAEAASREAPSAAEDALPVETRRVWNDADGNLAVSADGRFATYPDWNTGNLALRDLATGETRSLTGNVTPYEHGFGFMSAWAPGGERIAYSWEPNGPYSSYELRVVDREGGSERTVYGAPGTGYLQPEAWTPDGRAVVAQRSTPDGANQIVLIDVEDGSLRSLRSLGWQWSGVVAVSPDGRWVAYERSETDEPFDLDVRVVAVDGSREEVVLATPGNDRLLGWDPAGGSILALIDDGGVPAVVRVPVRDGRRAGTPRAVLPDAWHVRPVGFAADGRYFYTVTSGSREVWQASLDPADGNVVGSARRLSRANDPGASVADYSPDGRHVLLHVSSRSSVPGEGLELAIRSVESGDVRFVRTEPRLRYIGTTRWIPGTHQAVARARTGPGLSSPPELFRIDLQTGQAEAVTASDGEESIMGYSLAVSPDGRTVYFQTESEGEGGGAVYRLRAQDLNAPPGPGRLVWRVPDGMGEGRPRVRAFEVSPDGSRMALRFGNEAPVGSRTSDIYLLPLAGGEPRRVVRLEGQEQAVAFHPTRRELWAPQGDMTSGEPLVLKRIDLYDGTVRDAGLERHGLGFGLSLFGAGLRFSPDGRRLAFTAGQPKLELWEMKDPSRTEAGGKR